MQLPVILIAIFLIIGGARAENVTPTPPNITASAEMERHSDTLRNIMRTLYLYNPDELKKSTTVSANEMVQWVFEGPFNWKFDAIRKLQGAKALALAFDQTYRGDRILPLVAGIHTMLVKAYGGESTFKFTAAPNPEYLHDTARSIEHTLHLLRAEQHEEKALVMTGKDGAVENEMQVIIHQLQQHARYFARHPDRILPPLNEGESIAPDFFNF